MQNAHVLSARLPYQTHLRITQPTVQFWLVKRTAVATTLLIIAIGVYWRTAFPSITWWDSTSYSLAAATLGVSSAPGSLLLMLIGWPIAHLPLGTSPAYRLNLLAGVLAATAALIVYFAALQVNRMGSADDQHSSNANAARRIGAGAGALTFAFGSTTWEHAVMFTPYILTAVFTAALLYVLFRWWAECTQYDSWKWLALLGLLFGLDFSVHRTNALLIPGALVFVLLRSPRAFASARNIVGGAIGLFAGLSVQLLVIPIARTTSSDLNFGNPRDFSRFMEYVSLSQSGGNFFVKIYPRNSDVWSVQVPHFFSALADNTLHWNGNSGIAGVLPALAALVGLTAIARSNLRLGVALICLLVMQAAMTVIFFNIPADYFRSLDRHYLPVMVTIGVCTACGLGAIGQWIGNLQFKRGAPVLASSMLLLAVPAAQLVDNWKTRDASNRYFAHDYALNALNGLPPNAILFTVGDNDTYPLMYMQGAEHVRHDVRIVNLSVIQYKDYPDQRLAHDPTFPITVLSAQRNVVVEKPWTDTLLTMPFAGDNAQFGLPRDTTTLSSAQFVVKPAWGDKMTLGDITFLDIVRTNAWKRPLTFSLTGSRSAMSWLEPYGRLEGMYWRIVPLMHPSANGAALRKNLLNTYSYRGYADSSVVLDPVAAQLGFLYYEPFTELITIERSRGDAAACRIAADKSKLLPFSRLFPRQSSTAATNEENALPACTADK